MQTLNEFSQGKINLYEEDDLVYDDDIKGYWITTKTGKRIAIDKDRKAITTLGGTVDKGTKFTKVKGL